MSQLNTCVMNILAVCNKETMLHVLLQLLTHFREDSRMQFTINNCLMKMLNSFIEQIDTIDIEETLLRMHLFLKSVNHKLRSQHDEKSVGIVKTITYKIVAARKESVIESYQVVRAHKDADKHLHKWIKCGLQNLQKELSPTKLYGRKVAHKNAKI